MSRGAFGFVVGNLKIPKELSFEAGICRAKNLLLRCWLQADSSPIELASE
jgi:hypothetical protein